MKKTVANRRMFRQGGAVNSGPTGILASSPSLIDAVAQDAMNVQGGPTVRMADGGIVRGSAARLPQNLDERIQLILQRRSPGRLPEFLNPPPLSELPSPVTAVEATMKPRSERLSGEELLNLSLGARTILPPEISDEIIEYPATPVRSGQSSLPPSTVMRSNIDDPVYDMETLTAEYLQGDPDNVVKEYLRSIAGTPAYGKIFSALQDAEMQAQQSGEVPTTAVPLGFEDFEQQDVDPEMGTSDVIGPRVDDPTVSDTVGEPGEEGGGDKVSVPKTAKGPAFNEGVDTVMGPGDEFEDPNAGKYKMAGEEAVNQIKEAAKSGNEEETKNKLEDYINEFKSAIPEYEGKSEAEKGFDLVKMGMAVAAGESPEAITNISKGVLATIDNFTEDEKAKRAYKQQVAMSAAKYGLENVRRDRTAAAALAKERRARVEYVANKSGVDPRSGRKFKKGDVLTFSAGDIHDGALGDFAPGTVVLPKTFSDIQSGIAASNKALLKGKIKYSEFQKDRELYGELSKNYVSGMQMKLLLGDAAKVIEEDPGNVLGATGFIKKASDSVLNTLGFRTEEERASYLKGLGKGKEFDALMKQISTKMITQILNEGNRTISDADRQRVDELVGSYGDYISNVPGSLSALRIKMTGLAKSIDQGILESEAQMNTIESSYNNALNAENYKILQGFKARRLGRVGTATGATLRKGKDGMYRIVRPS
jgi:hypothetical protein